VVLAVAGFALARKGRERTGGIVLAVAVLTKVWPLFLAPALLIDRRRRAAGWFAGALLAGGTAWVAASGVGALGQVASFRGVTGWHIESAVGVVVWILTGGPTRGELGAIRVGSMAPWARAGLALATVVLLAAVWMKARRREGKLDPLGRPAVSALSGAIVLSPVWAGHYVSWLLPWGAIAARHRGGRTTARTLFVVSLFTAFVGASLDFGNWEGSGPHIPIVKAALLAIHVLLAFLALEWIVRRSGAEDRSAKPNGDPDPAGGRTKGHAVPPTQPT
jgi:hypothetical protein